MDYANKYYNAWVDAIVDTCKKFNITKEDFKKNLNLLNDYDFWDSIGGSRSYENAMDYISEEVNNTFKPSQLEIDEFYEYLLEREVNFSDIKSEASPFGIKLNDLDDFYNLESYEQIDILNAVIDNYMMEYPPEIDPYTLQDAIERL